MSKAKAYLVTVAAEYAVGYVLAESPNKAKVLGLSMDEMDAGYLAFRVFRCPTLDNAPCEVWRAQMIDVTNLSDPQETFLLLNGLMAYGGGGDCGNDQLFSAKKLADPTQDSSKTHTETE